MSLKIHMRPHRAAGGKRRAGQDRQVNRKVPRPDLAPLVGGALALLVATERIVVGTGIASISSAV